MYIFVINKIIYNALLIISIIVLSFALFRVTLDPVRARLGPYATSDQVGELGKKYYFNKPIEEQVMRYVFSAAKLDFGISLNQGRPVRNILFEKIGKTLCLILISFMYVFLYSLFVTISVVLKGNLGKLINRIIKLLNIIFVILPTLLSSVLVALVVYGIFNFSGFSGSINSLKDIIYFVPGAFVLSLYPMAVISVTLKDRLENEYKKIYILAAKSLSISKFQIITKYLIKNSIVPCLSIMSFQLPALFTGAFIVEIVFNIPATGKLLVESLESMDIFVLEGIVILNGIIFIMSNLIFDTINKIIDYRYKSNREYTI